MLCCLAKHTAFLVALTAVRVSAGVLEGLDLNWLEDADKDVAFPVRIKLEDGSRTTSLWPCRESLGAERTRRGADKSPLVYQLSGFDVDYELQMAPNEALLSPSAIMQTVERGSDGFENVLTEDIADERCHLTGVVVTDRHSNSSEKGRAAISVCDGNLTGFLRMPHEEIHIQAAYDGKDPSTRPDGQPHVLRRRSVASEAKGRQQECHVTEADDVPLMKSRHHQYDHSEHDASSRTARQLPGDHVLHVETMIAVDKHVIAKHKMTDLQLKTYVLTLMNIANLLWADKATGVDVRFVVVRLLLLKSTPPQLTLSTNSLVLMRSFCVWQNRINNPNDAFRLHHDYAILLTGNELCARGDVACGELGRAYVEAMCRPHYSCQVTYDSGIRSSFVIAHEAGHSFGMFHDGDRNPCNNSRELMSSQVSGKANLYHWSTCSKRYIENYMRDPRNYECMLDLPSRSALNYPDRWTGLKYDLDDQCSFQVGKKSTFCRFSWAQNRICQALWCSEDHVCTTVYIPAADGSTCDTNKVCVRGQCVPENEKESYMTRDAPVHGSWSDWSVLSHCSRSCGGGIQYQRRQCNSPAPRNGGRMCEGKSYNLELCNTLPCPDDSENVREKVCFSRRDKNRDPFQPYYHRTRTCTVYCYDMAKRRPRRQKTQLVDGSRCYPNTESNDRCFEGRCEVFGCDKKWNSKAMTDKCGVCQGSGRTCRIQEKNFNQRVATSGYNNVCEIPALAKNVVVREIGIETNVHLAVRLQNPRLYVLNGNEQSGAAWRNVKAAGTVIEYSRRVYDYDRETIRISGPLQQSINIMTFVSPSGTSALQNVTCQYSVATHGQEPKLGSFMYLWKRIQSKCSSTCRGGMQTVAYSCYVPTWRMSVNYQFCGASTPPKRQVVPCNTDVLCEWSGNAAPPPAPSYRWRVDSWRMCSATCGPGRQIRFARCYDDTTFDYVELSRCQDPVPSTSRTCTVAACPLIPVHGGWSEWKASGDCSRTCGTGVQLEIRTCSNPSPKNGGRFCTGQSKRRRCCNTQVCKYAHGNATDELTAQCRKKYPNSVAHYSRPDLFSCRISCQLANGAVRGIDAEDGTRCDLRTAKRCLDGACWRVGCDCLFGSLKVPTSCGLCADESAQCMTVLSKYRIQHGIAGYYHVLDIPAGVYQLHIRHVHRSQVAAAIMIRSFSGVGISSSDFFGTVSDYRFAFGGEISYRYIAASNEESLFFNGPSPEAFEIFCHVSEYRPNSASPDIDVSYVVSNALKYQVDELTDLHGWTVVKSGCSAECGTRVGFEKWEAQCALKETGVHVRASLCSTDYKPRMVQGLPCKTSGNCPGMEWQATDWTPCSVSCGSGEQRGSVSCVSKSTKSRVKDELCDESLRPSSTRRCISPDCVPLVNIPQSTTPVPIAESPFAWEVRKWKPCSVTCGEGFRMRTVRCIHKAAKTGKHTSRCAAFPRPDGRRTCDAGLCPRPTTALPTTFLPTTTIPPTTSASLPTTSVPTESSSTGSSSQFVWAPKHWKSCSVTCGVGFQKRGIPCIDRITGRAKVKSLCDPKLMPSDLKQCRLTACPPTPAEQRCASEPSYCGAIRHHRLCTAPNFVGKCCKSCS